MSENVTIDPMAAAIAILMCIKLSTVWSSTRSAGVLCYGRQTRGRR